jgi:phi13 family phage major tail protein
MSQNKITYGFEKVHIAFKGVSQTETIEVTNHCTTDGEITVTVTAETLLSGVSPVSVVVPLAAETHTTVTKVASAIVNALNNNASIAGVFTASNLLGVITLKTKVAQANDATLAIAVTVGSTGVTVGPSTSGTTGNASWGPPTHINGAVRWTPEPVGESSTFFAENTAYFVITANNGYTGELELVNVPDNIKAEMLGWEIDDNGMLVEMSNGIQKEFAMMGQVLGDVKNRRFVYYSCKAARPAKELSTKAEQIEPNTDVLSVTVSPVEINGRTVVKGDLELNDSNVDVYNGFFNAVYTPVFS